MSQQVHFVKDFLNGVEIDRPINHELSTYAQGVNHDGSPRSPFDHAGNAIQSIKYKGLDEYDDLPVFTVRFKIGLDSVQEIAADFWRITNTPKIVEVWDDAIVVEADCLAACSVDTNVNPVIIGAAPYQYPVDCWFSKNAILEAGSVELAEDAIDEAEDNDHWCSGNIYEYAIAVVRAGSDTVKNSGDMSIELFNFEDGIFTMTDEEIRENFWDDPDLLTVVTSPDGSEWRVISNSHED
jgi:hypothetical protein